jgi:aldose 1-epimerase
MALAPSGEQFEIRHEDQVVVVTEVGATLRSYRRGERDVLDGFDLDARCDGGRGQVLVPWPNRVRDGRYHWAGEEHQLPIDETALGNAIHGLVRWRNWQLLAWEPTRLILGLQLHPMPGYPFALALTVAYALDEGGLRVRTSAENVGAHPCPYGVGHHPYLTVGGTLDTASLSVPAERMLIADERSIPVSSRPVADTAFDFRSARAIGDLVLDTCFADLRRDGDGRARVVLAAQEVSVTLWMGESHPYVMIFSGDTLAAPRRRRGLAVEPMSCPPNAFASSEGVVTLEPGQTHDAEWGIEI